MIGVPRDAPGWNADAPTFSAPEPHPTLPLRAGIEIVVVLTVSLVAGKLVVDALVDYRWPVVVYIGLLSLIGYGPSLWWARRVSRRHGTGQMWSDLGARPRAIDVAWGPVVWLACVACQIVAAVIVTILRIPAASNTEGLSDAADDRTYVIAIVVTAVLAAPVVEELVFRGVLLRALLSRVRGGAGDRRSGGAVRCGARRSGARRRQHRVGDRAVGRRGCARHGGVPAAAHRRVDGGPRHLERCRAGDRVHRCARLRRRGRVGADSAVGRHLRIGLEGVTVVDQAHLADPHRRGDAHRTWSAT